MTAMQPAWGRVVRTVLAAVVPRPWLWPTGVGAFWRLAHNGWWRRWPPAPLPGAGYWRFRAVTAYGGTGEQVPSVEDVVAFLYWCRRTSRLRG